MKAKATHLKSIDANSDQYDKPFYDGMATAYHLVKDEVKNTIIFCELSLEEFGLDDYNPNEILTYKPLNSKDKKDV